MDNYRLYVLLDEGVLIAAVTITLADHDHSLYTTTFPDVWKSNNNGNF